MRLTRTAVCDDTGLGDRIGPQVEAKSYGKGLVFSPRWSNGEWSRFDPADLPNRDPPLLMEIGVSSPLL